MNILFLAYEAMISVYIFAAGKLFKHVLKRRKWKPQQTRKKHTDLNISINYLDPSNGQHSGRYVATQEHAQNCFSLKN